MTVKEFFKIVLLVSLIILPTDTYIYCRGMADGIKFYRGSRQFALTLYSMYRFGYMDGADTCKGKK